ncbi:winged helix-turn-helix domain-containing protein [Streptosporangium sp. NPDC002607]
MTWGYRSLPIVFRVIHFRPDQPKSEQVLNEIRRRIQAGDYKPGYPIPGEPRMAEEFGIARRTARKVINALIAEGLVYTVRNSRMRTFSTALKAARCAVRRARRAASVPGCGSSAGPGTHRPAHPRASRSRQ